MSESHAGMILLEYEIFYQALRRGLMLPEHYKVVHVMLGDRGEVAVYVQSPDLPDSPNRPFPLVVPHYQRERGEDGKETVSLLKIEVQA